MKDYEITEKVAYKLLKIVYNLPRSEIKEKTCAFFVIIHTETKRKKKNETCPPVTFSFLG